MSLTTTTKSFFLIRSRRLSRLQRHQVVHLDLPEVCEEHSQTKLLTLRAQTAKHAPVVLTKAHKEHHD